MDNIKSSAALQNVELKKVSKQRNLIMCDFDSGRDEIVNVLKAVFGIRYFSFIEEVKRDEGEIVKKVGKMIEHVKAQGHKTVRFDTKRSDKKFPLNSPELNAKFGEVANKLGLKVDYRNALETIFVEITAEKCFVYSEKVRGHGGLPVGTSGKVLCLLSGGIDSPVAAWLMMKRGCKVDFIHVHNMKSSSDVEKSKMKEILGVLNKYQFNSKLFLVPYTTYEFSTMGKVAKRYDLILFKHYLLKLAESVALRRKYKAIVTGDNLAQVASQTLDNLKAAGYSVSLPIFRPLLTYDKEEIVDLANRAGTFKPSIKPYKDCCSILAKSPELNTNLEIFKKELENVDVKKLLQDNFEEIDIINS